MKKNKPAVSATPAVQTFGGDYHKCESTFRPRATPTSRAGVDKRKSAAAAKGQAKA